MEKAIAELITSFDGDIVTSVLKIFLVILVTQWMRHMVAKLFAYYSIINHDVNYTTVYEIDGDPYVVDKVTFKFVIVRNVDDNRKQMQFPLKVWATTVRTIVLVNSGKH